MEYNFFTLFILNYLIYLLNKHILNELYQLLKFFKYQQKFLNLYLFKIIYKTNMNYQREVILFLFLLFFMKLKFATSQLLTKNKLKYNLKKSINILNINNIRDGKENFQKLDNFDNYIKNIDINNKNLSKFNFSNIEQFSSNEVKYCSLKNCHMPHGFCVNERQCKCSINYSNFQIPKFHKNDFLTKILKYLYLIKDGNPKEFCTNKRKSQFIAFILESIFLVGVGHFYLFRIFHGLMKLIFMMIILLLIYLIRKIKIEVKFYYTKINLSLILNFLHTFFTSFFIVLHFFDILLLINNYYLDGFGITVVSWNEAYVNNIF